MNEHFSFIEYRFPPFFLVIFFFYFKRFVEPFQVVIKIEIRQGMNVLEANLFHILSEKLQVRGISLKIVQLFTRIEKCFTPGYLVRMSFYTHEVRPERYIFLSLEVFYLWVHFRQMFTAFKCSLRLSKHHTANVCIVVSTFL